MCKFPTDILAFAAEDTAKRLVRLRIVGCTTYSGNTGDDDFARLLFVTIQARSLAEALAIYGQFWTTISIESALASGELTLKTVAWVVPCTLNNAVLKLRVESTVDADFNAPYSLLAFDDEYVYAGFETHPELPRLPRGVVAGTFSMFVNYICQRALRCGTHNNKTKTKEG